MRTLLNPNAAHTHDGDARNTTGQRPVLLDMFDRAAADAGLKEIAALGAWVAKQAFAIPIHRPVVSVAAAGVSVQLVVLTQPA